MNKKATNVKVKHVDRVYSRAPPHNLFLVIRKLSDGQKDVLREIGFGKLLEFKIKDFPTRLAYWLLDNFDEEECCLMVDGNKIEINKEVIRDVLGVPLGDVHIDAPDEADFKNPLTQTWKA